MADVPLAERITKALAQHGLSQAELAKRVGVTQPTISEAARGADVRLSTYTRITRALDELDAPVEAAS